MKLDCHVIKPPTFTVQNVLSTPGIVDALTEQELTKIIGQHITLDCDPETGDTVNDNFLKQDRLLSAVQVRDYRIFIISEYNPETEKNHTTVMLAEEY